MSRIKTPTKIADAPEGAVSFDQYPNVQAWLKRIEDHLGFVPMVSSRKLA